MSLLNWHFWWIKKEQKEEFNGWVCNNGLPLLNLGVMMNRLLAVRMWPSLMDLIISYDDIIMNIRGISNHPKVSNFLILIFLFIPFFFFQIIVGFSCFFSVGPSAPQCTFCFHLYNVVLLNLQDDDTNKKLTSAMTLPPHFSLGLQDLLQNCTFIGFACTVDHGKCLRLIYKMHDIR